MLNRKTHRSASAQCAIDLATMIGIAIVVQFAINFMNHEASRSVYHPQVLPGECTRR